MYLLYVYDQATEGKCSGSVRIRSSQMRSFAKESRSVLSFFPLLSFVLQVVEDVNKGERNG